MYAILGNHKAAAAANLVDDDGNPVKNKEGVTLQTLQPIRGKQRTEIVFPDGHRVRDAFADITNPGGIWAHHATEGSTPKWVASDSPELATLLSTFYECEVRDPLPEGEKGKWAGSAFAQHILGVVGLMVGMILLLALRAGLVDLRTNAGTDWLSGIMGNSTAAPMAYMALSATSGELATHTALAGEITTAGGGLIRKAFTYAHTTGTSTWTATATFTANGTDSLPVSPVQIAVFNASSAGVMGFEKTVTSATFAAIGDAVTYTYTFTP